MKALFVPIAGKNPLTEAHDSSLPTHLDKFPVHHRWGKLLKIGETYTHPLKGFKVEASPKKVRALEDNFKKMKDNGVKVWVSDDHSAKAADSRGTVIALRRNDGWLEALLQLVGDDALKTAVSNELSAGIKPDFKDGLDNDYPGGVIEHVALTPCPVVPNQSGLLNASRQNNLSNQLNPNSFTANRGEDGATVYYLSTAANQDRSIQMGTKMSAEHKKMCMALLSGMPGVGDDTDDDTMMSKLMSEHGAMKKDIGDGFNTTLGNQVKALSRENRELIETKTTLENQITELNLSREQQQNLSAVNAEALFERSLRVGKDFDLLVDRKICTPAVAQEFKEAVMGSKESPNVLSLSRDPENPTDDCLAAKVVAVALKFQPGPATGSVTGTQTLSRDNHQNGGGEQTGFRTIKSPHTGKEVQVPIQ